jgi:hypothetical protein
MAGTCNRFDVTQSSAYDGVKINLPWRTDFPTTIPSVQHAWESKKFESDWRGYINAVLQEVRASGIKIQGNKITMPADAPWWITPWMDFGPTGRERLQGLTSEHPASGHELGPRSRSNLQTRAIGWYNAEGALALGQIFADPCNPSIPAVHGGARWTFPNQTASFKFLFTEATDQDVLYPLGDAPTVEAITSDPQQPTTLRLLQVDIAVRDPQATATGWVFGTFVWKGPAKGDGLFDNLVPVGLMWGNDPRVQNNSLSGFAALQQTKLNPDLAGLVWQGPGQSWPERPYPGFQGRLNGPADNWRSSCISCHSAAQYQRNPKLERPDSTLKQNGAVTSTKIAQVVADFFDNVQGGHLISPAQDAVVPLTATPLDYSLQLQTSFVRICQACQAGAIHGATPDICLTTNHGPINTATCPLPTSKTAIRMRKAQKTDVRELFPRQ